MSDIFDPMSWLDAEETRREESRDKDYFKFVEGDNRFMLLTHCAPYAQVWNQGTRKYEPAQEGEQNATIRGICWVYQEKMIKQAELPYTVVAQIRSFQKNPDWGIDSFPIKHIITVNAIGAGSKDVKYNTTLSPKEFPIPAEILAELKTKMTPEQLVEKKKGKAAGNAPASAPSTGRSGIEYPKVDINPEDIPF